jgi:hypothetical protein
MAEATSNLLPRFQQVKIEALRLARNAVKDRIRGQNLRIEDYEAAEITRWRSGGSTSIAPSQGSSI